MKRLKKDQCRILASIRVEAEFHGKKRLRRGSFEKNLEEAMLDFFNRYVEAMVDKTPQAGVYEWVVRGMREREHIRKPV